MKIYVVVEYFGYEGMRNVKAFTSLEGALIFIEESQKHREEYCWQEIDLENQDTAALQYG